MGTYDKRDQPAVDTKKVTEKKVRLNQKLFR